MSMEERLVEVYGYAVLVSAVEPAAIVEGAIIKGSRANGSISKAYAPVPLEIFDDAIDVLREAKKLYRSELSKREVH